MNRPRHGSLYLVSFLGQLDVYSESQASYIPGTADPAPQVKCMLLLQRPH